MLLLRCFKLSLDLRSCNGLKALSADRVDCRITICSSGEGGASVQGATPVGVRRLKLDLGLRAAISRLQTRLPLRMVLTAHRAEFILGDGAGGESSPRLDILTQGDRVQNCSFGVRSLRGVVFHPQKPHDRPDVRPARRIRFYREHCDLIFSSQSVRSIDSQPGATHARHSQTLQWGLQPGDD